MFPLYLFFLYMFAVCLCSFGDESGCITNSGHPRLWMKNEAYGMAFFYTISVYTFISRATVLDVFSHTNFTPKKLFIFLMGPFSVVLFAIMESIYSFSFVSILSWDSNIWSLMIPVFLAVSFVLTVQGIILYDDTSDIEWYYPTIFKYWIIYILLTFIYYITLYSMYYNNNRCVIHIHHSTAAFHGALSLWKPSNTILQVALNMFMGIAYEGIATYGAPITLTCEQ